MTLNTSQQSGYREKGDPAEEEAEVLALCMLDIREPAHERKLMNDAKIQNPSARHRFDQATEDADRNPDVISCCSPAWDSLDESQHFTLLGQGQTHTMGQPEDCHVAHNSEKPAIKEPFKIKK